MSKLDALVEADPTAPGEDGSESALKPGRTPLVSLKGITFGYGTSVVLDDVSFDVADGEFVSIIGPSGCGKSTLLQMLDGMLEPDSGEVRIGGTPVRDSSIDRAMVFQSFALLPWKTVLENVALGLGYRRKDMSRRQRTATAKDYLGRVGLSRAADLYPRQISGGMQQRVGLARAFAVQPRLLLMDEPFGALDAQNAEILREDLRVLVAEHERTIIFVTHNLDEALQLSDRVLLMSAAPARIREQLSPKLDGLDHDDDRARYDANRERLWTFLKEEVGLVNSRMTSEEESW